jgi:hypothetical protein
MIEISYSLVFTSERTIRVMVGRMREYITLEHKTRTQLFDAVKFALLSKDVPVNADRLNAELDDMIWNHVPKHMWY